MFQVLVLLAFLGLVYYVIMYVVIPTLFSLTNNKRKGYVDVTKKPVDVVERDVEVLAEKEQELNEKKAVISEILSQKIEQAIELKNKLRKQ